MSKHKRCPRCASEAEKPYGKGEYARCSNLDCGMSLLITPLEEWNNRPLEAELLEALEATLEWIDAVPSDVALPAMPGFDRDEMNALIAKHKGDG